MSDDTERGRALHLPPREPGAWADGFREALRLFAVWRDGEERVGCGVHTWREILEELRAELDELEAGREPLPADPRLELAIDALDPKRGGVMPLQQVWAEGVVGHGEEARRFTLSTGAGLGNDGISFAIDGKTYRTTARSLVDVFTRWHDEGWAGRREG